MSTFTTAAAFFIAAVVAGLSYLTRNRKHGRAAHPMTVREILQVNAVTTGAFGAFYVAATLIPPTAASVLETGIGPFVVAVVMGLTAGNVGRRLRQPATVLAVCLVVTGIALTVLPTHSSGGMVALGIGLTVLAGSCAVGVLLTSHALSSRGVTALQIGAARFHLAWIVSGVIAFPTIVQIAPGDHAALLTFVIVGIFGIAGPILLLQWGITLAQPLQSALVLSLLPAVVMVGDFFFTDTTHPLLIIGMLVLVSTSLFGVVIRGKS